MNICIVYMASWNFSQYFFLMMGQFYGHYVTLQFLKGIYYLTVCNFDLYFTCCDTSCISYKHFQMGYTTFSVSNKCKRYICMSLYYKGFIVKKKRSIKVNKNKYTLGWIDCLKEKIHVKVLVTQSCLTLCKTMDCSPPGSSVHEILQARILEWIAIPLSRESSWLRDRTWVSHIAGRFFTIWAINSVQFSGSVMSNFCDCCTPGLPVHHQPLELSQTHVHQVGDVIQLP